jgi:2-methylcitrate dehydratase PrpD
MTADPHLGTAVSELAELAVTIRTRGLSPLDRQAATRATVDWFGATIAGSVMDPARILVRALATETGGHSGLVPASDLRLPARVAALINATASHTAEMDDIYREGIYHPGSPTVGAALALAQELDVSGERMLRAIAVGYEIGDRIAETVNPNHYRFWHTTGTVGTIGAAAAGADLLELDEGRTAHAMATAVTMAAGLQQAFRSDAMSKPLHAGHAAEAGLLAARAAAEGLTGALDVLDGDAGFGAAMAGDPGWAEIAADPDRQLGINRATVKNHSCCGHTFAAVDAALRLRAEGLRAEDVDALTIRTYITATKVAGNPDPTTAFEAKFSTAYCVAAALVLGSVRLRAFEPDALQDPLIRSVAARVILEGDASMESEFPGRRRATVTVRDRSGREWAAMRDTRKGDPDDPLTEAELADKFVDLAEPVIGAERTSTLSGQLWRVAELSSMRDVG